MWRSFGKYINASHFGASVAVVLRLSHVKLVLNIEVDKSTLSIISAHTARNPFSEAIKEEIRSASLRDDGGIDVTITTTNHLKEPPV
ncbi:hypothetical protein EVAR_52997_1 [Eumeta japonica]|uniref:Uncharacterized protein n=1 Tax=Eumeta variegata TaxID=151549 RepID=A0A4C1YPQ9_EUMVA|nr:hypothetical protein EVAR_52997_1 [Eumeta japonica]